MDLSLGLYKRKKQKSYTFHQNKKREREKKENVWLEENVCTLKYIFSIFNYLSTNTILIYYVKSIR